MPQMTRSDALELAGEIVEVIAQRGSLSLHLDHIGTLHVQLGVAERIAAFDLIGVYDRGATMGRIADDILAVRAEQAARAAR